MEKLDAWGWPKKRKKREKAQRDFVLMVSGIVHDLKIALSAAFMSQERFLEDSGPHTTSKEYRTAVQSAIDNCMLGYELASSLIDFVRFQAGRVVLRDDAVDVEVTLSSIIGLFEGTLRERGIESSVVIDPALDSFLEMDQLRFQQVLLNLVSNGMKFADSQLNVAVVVSGKKQDKIRLTVTDDGAGMTSQEQKLIFEPFKQANKEVEKSNGGHGLGLAVVRHIVRLMGGEVGVESFKGDGTTFWVELPLKKAGPDAKKRSMTDKPVENAIDPESLPKGVRVLVVEDDPTSRRVQELGLQRFGAEVQSATNGVEALTLFVQEKFDLVLMDMTLKVPDGHVPRIDGVDVTRVMRKIEKKRKVKSSRCSVIVGLSANPKSDINPTTGAREKSPEYRACLKAGMDDMLEKSLKKSPFDQILAEYGEREKKRGKGKKKKVKLKKSMGVVEKIHVKKNQLKSLKVAGQELVEKKKGLLEDEPDEKREVPLEAA